MITAVARPLHRRRSSSFVCLGAAALLFASTVRGQISDDPWTIENGRTQIEVDFVYTADDDDGTRTRSVNSGALLVTRGVTDHLDFQVGFDGHYHDRVRSAGALSKSEDWGDVTIGAKYNLWGNDSDGTVGDTAFALLPYVKIPLKLGDAGSELVEGGLILPLAVALPASTTLVVMTEFDVVADSADRDHEFQWIESVVLSRPFTDKISGFAEFYSVLPTESGTDWSALINVGFYYSFTPDFCLDAGCAFGVTRSAPDIQPFIGLTYLY